MKGRKKIPKGIGLGTILSVCLMIFCLTYLTTLNFFLYQAENEVIAQNNNPAGPTEEKSSNTGFSLAEEILHEKSFEFDSRVNNYLFLHHIEKADKLQIVHPELILRPPRF